MASHRSAWTIAGFYLFLSAILLWLWPGIGQHPETPQLASATGPLYLQWVRAYSQLQPAWPDQPKLQFDAAYQPVIAGTTVYVASSRIDSVTALDLETGSERWRFMADGPVRFAPVVRHGRVYFVSDDGHLYCLDAECGKLVWRFRGGPSDRQVLGNGRLISTWPARGAPAIASDGTVYFAAGIWPFMGIFLHALDARTGQQVWTSDGDGSTFREQPHQADAFAGIAPQGHLQVAGDRLLVPGGRSVPACYDRRTGRLLYYHLADHAKSAGGFQVTAGSRLFVNGGTAFDQATGESLGQVGQPAILADDVLYACSGPECRAYDVSEAGGGSEELAGRGRWWRSWSVPVQGSVAIPDCRTIDVLARDGTQLYAAAGQRVHAIKLPLQGTREAAWSMEVSRPVGGLAASAGRLVVATANGRICCYGPKPTRPTYHPWRPATSSAASHGWTETTRRLLAATGARDGYCIAWGAGTGQLVRELLRQSRMHVVVVEPDLARARAFRDEMVAAGWYGERVAVLPGSWSTVELPPYLASLMVAEDPDALDPSPACLDKVFASLRPYGGTACLPMAATNVAVPPQARWRRENGWLLLSREGPLPGSANWTHEHADAANTRVSQDSLVRAPLGLLWFGGTSHHGILPRHGHGPQPQVIDGRLIIEGHDQLRALDIYTGRLLWEAALPKIGEAFDHTFHQPGANGSGSNYVSTTDSIYVAYRQSCLRLDPATGRCLGTVRLPRLPGLADPDWSYVNVAGPYLIGGANPPAGPGRALTLASSKHLVVFDRKSGEVRWTAAARHGFRHNAICAGNGRLHAIDRPGHDYWERRGADPSADPVRLLAFGLASGKLLWSTTQDVFGTYLSCSERHDLLLESGLVARDTLWDEADGVRAWTAGTGRVLWHDPDLQGPAMIHGDQALLGRGACELRTGRPVLRRDPLTGQPVPWRWVRDYGCNTPAASLNLLTFRSGAAGFFDLAGDGGTGNLGGFRSGCTNNLIVAGGVLSAPDYTRTCVCSYQNQTSLALVPTPDAEMWTYFGRQALEAPVHRVGINLGAPGNRKADDGTLWLEYPYVGGPSYRLPIHTLPERPEVFRHHSSWVESAEPGWVAASGLRGLQSLTVRLAPPFDTMLPDNDPEPPARKCTVRLHFLEPDDRAPGERVFHVDLQGERVLSGLDICQIAGGPRRGVVKELHGVRVARDLVVTLMPAAPGAGVPVLCGIEVRVEK